MIYERVVNGIICQKSFPMIIRSIEPFNIGSVLVCFHISGQYSRRDVRNVEVLPGRGKRQMELSSCRLLGKIFFAERDRKAGHGGLLFPGTNYARLGRPPMYPHSEQYPSGHAEEEACDGSAHRTVIATAMLEYR
jgi:hypothetical protein